jgi:hypothetical protein
MQTTPILSCPTTNPSTAESRRQTGDQGPGLGVQKRPFSFTTPVLKRCDPAAASSGLDASRGPTLRDPLEHTKGKTIPVVAAPQKTNGNRTPSHRHVHLPPTTSANYLTRNIPMRVPSPTTFSLLPSARTRTPRFIFSSHQAFIHTSRPFQHRPEPTQHLHRIR